MDQYKPDAKYTHTSDISEEALSESMVFDSQLKSSINKINKSESHKYKKISRHKDLEYAALITDIPMGEIYQAVPGPPPIDAFGNTICTDGLVWNDEYQKWVHPNGFAPNPFTQFEDIFVSKSSKDNDIFTNEEVKEESTSWKIEKIRKYLVEGSVSYKGNEISRLNLEATLDYFDEDSVKDSTIIETVISGLEMKEIMTIKSMLSDDSNGYKELDASKRLLEWINVYENACPGTSHSDKDISYIS